MEGNTPPGPSGAHASHPPALPTELRNFLGQPGSVTLLVRGGPGTGRTRFAEAVVREVTGPVLLITDERAHVEGGALSTPPGLRLAHLHEVAQDPSFASFLAPPGPDGSTQKWEAIVVDSWDSFTELAFAQRRRPGAGGPETERGLFSRICDTTRRLIAIGGSGRTTAVEFMVDGIVELVQSHVDERTERWLRIVKLRGMPLGAASFPFSLTGGRFRAFDVSPSEVPVSLRGIDDDPDPSARGLWPGTRDYANVFGRLTGGGLTLVECDPRAPLMVRFALVYPALIHSFFHAGRIAFVPPPSVSPGDIVRIIRSDLPPEMLPSVFETVGRRVRILSSVPSPELEASLEESLLPLERASAGPPILMSTGSEGSSAFSQGTPPDSPLPRFPRLDEFLLQPVPEGPNLQVIFLSGLVAAAREVRSGYTPEALASAIQRSLDCRHLHTVMIGPTDDPLIQGLKGIATTNVTIVPRQGRYFVRGERPWTENFLLDFPTGGEMAPYHLVPVG